MTNIAYGDYAISEVPGYLPQGTVDGVRYTAEGAYLGHVLEHWVDSGARGRYECRYLEVYRDEQGQPIAAPPSWRRLVLARLDVALSIPCPRHSAEQAYVRNRTRTDAG